MMDNTGFDEILENPKITILNNKESAEYLIKEIRSLAEKADLYNELKKENERLKEALLKEKQ